MRHKIKYSPPLWVYFIEVQSVTVNSGGGYGDPVSIRKFVAAPNRLEAIRCFFGADCRERDFRKKWSRWGSSGIAFFGIEGMTEHWAIAMKSPGIVFESHYGRSRTRRAKQALESPRPWAMWNIPDEEAERRNLDRELIRVARNPLQRVSAKSDPYARKKASGE